MIKQHPNHPKQKVPETDKMDRFLDPEIVKKIQFLDTEIAKMDVPYF